MATLNIGCGRDSWGDIRLDLTKSQTGVFNRPNVIASAVALPIRNSSISDVRCWHVLEHVSHWRALLDEISRVCILDGHVEIRFPIDDGFKRDFVTSWSRLDFAGMRHAYLTRKNRAHFWIIDPRLVSTKLGHDGFRIEFHHNKRWLFFPFWFYFPRWRRFLPRILSAKEEKVLGWVRSYVPRVDYEWVVSGERVLLGRRDRQ